jgi:hypothetical protein
MRKLILTLISVAALAALTGCGGSNSPHTSVPPSPSSGNNAGFSNASLNGTYVLSVNGYNSYSNYAYAVGGLVTADGNGNITAGVRDTVNDTGGQSLDESITGTYSVNQDGRGQMVLNGGSGQVIYRFVLQSGSTASLFQISATSDAVGKLEQQPQVVPQIVTAGNPTFIVTLNGEDASSSHYPYAAVGALTFNSGGSITGTTDENDAGTVGTQLSVSNGTYSIGSTGRGTASYTTATGTHNFIVYQVSSSRLEMISVDKNNFLYGGASLQLADVGDSSTFIGDQAFMLSGTDDNGYPIVEAGRLTLDGAGNINSGVEDANDNGTVTSALSFGGNYTLSSNGRWTSTQGTVSNGLIGWQVSPTESVLLTNNSAILQTGTMRAQTTGLTNASITGNYAQDLSGYYVNAGDVEITGNYLADGNGNLTGTYDSQTPSGDYTDNSGTGTYSVQSNGRSPASIGGVSLVMYVIDANTMYTVSSDPVRVYSGDLVHQ